MNMVTDISKGVLLLNIESSHLLRPISAIAMGHRSAPFPFQANSSTLTGPDSKVVGSRQIAQPFTKDEYVQPGPSLRLIASVSTSSAVSAIEHLLPTAESHFGVADVPQNPAGKVCHFYGC